MKRLIENTAYGRDNYADVTGSGGGNGAAGGNAACGNAAPGGNGATTSRDEYVEVAGSGVPVAAVSPDSAGGNAGVGGKLIAAGTSENVNVNAAGNEHKLMVQNPSDKDVSYTRILSELNSLSSQKKFKKHSFDLSMYEKGFSLLKKVFFSIQYLIDPYFFKIESHAISNLYDLKNDKATYHDLFSLPLTFVHFHLLERLLINCLNNDDLVLHNKVKKEMMKRNIDNYYIVKIQIADCILNNEIDALVDLKPLVLKVNHFELTYFYCKALLLFNFTKESSELLMGLFKEQKSTKVANLICLQLIKNNCNITELNPYLKFI